MIARKKRLVLFNKADLADPGSKAEVRDLARELDLPFQWASLKQDHKRMDQIIRWARNNVLGTRQVVDLGVVLVVGVPNCGKSTLINSLKHAARELGEL